MKGCAIPFISSLILFAVSTFVSSILSTQITRAPSLANLKANSRPMPKKLLKVGKNFIIIIII